MKRKKLVNVTCSNCSTPLLAFEQQKDGSTRMQSFGCGVQKTPAGPLLAVCPKCAHLEPFDRALLPS